MISLLGNHRLVAVDENGANVPTHRPHTVVSDDKVNEALWVMDILGLACVSESFGQMAAMLPPGIQGVILGCAHSEARGRKMNRSTPIFLSQNG